MVWISTRKKEQGAQESGNDKHEEVGAGHKKVGMMSARSGNKEHKKVGMMSTRIGSEQEK